MSTRKKIHPLWCAIRGHKWYPGGTKFLNRCARCPAVVTWEQRTYWHHPSFK